MTVEVGTVLAERYAIEAELGAGGMGVVWRARDLRLSRQVAVKVLATRQLARPGAIERFEREARVGAQLNHPHLIGTYDFGRLDDTVYLVLQLVTAGDLRDYAEARRPLEIQRACAVGYQIADALVAVHEAGIIHRDLKPENILVETADPLHVRIADFGMAYVDAADPAMGRVTHDGSFAGTPAYMAPEQIRDEGVGAPADIYALGCLLFELVTGTPPFEGAPATLIAKHVYAPPPRLRELRADVPSGLDELVERMLAKPVAMRPTADIVRLRLAHLLEGSLRPDETTVSERDRRMISIQAERVDMPLATTTTVEIGVTGTLDAEVTTALGVAGFTARAGASAPAVWRALGQSPEQLAALVATKIPVVVVGDRSGGATAVSSWVRIGVADVVFEPLAPATLVKKLQQVLARAR